MQKIELVKELWDYLHMNQKLEKSDCIIAMGCHDTDVAVRAAELYLDGWSDTIVATGGVGKITKDTMQKSEAEVYRDIMVDLGVPNERIILEKKSINTGENIIFTREILETEGLDFNSLIVVHKPYMERRAFATFPIRWPNKKYIVTSEQKSFDEYIKKYDDHNINTDDVINLIVGEIQRAKIYPNKGWIIEQEIPDHIWSAYEQLVNMGYDKYLFKG